MTGFDPAAIALRPVRPGDLATFHADQVDPGAARMAGHVPRTGAAFDAHWRRILATPDCVVRSVTVGDMLAGYVSSFRRDGRTEIAYWIGRAHWGRGVGGRAVALFLEVLTERPVFAQVVASNAASIAILTACGFVREGEERGADGLCEVRFRLDPAPAA